MNEETIKDAVLALFSREKVPPGGGLFVFDLYERWSKTCLRESDLKLGIETLIRSGELTYSEGETRAFVRLSEEGYRRCESFTIGSRLVTMALWTWARRYFNQPQHRGSHSVNRFRRSSEENRAAG